MSHKINRFSAPLPFIPEHIDLIASINERYKKSKITMLYNSLPANASDFSGFEQIRASSDYVHCLEDLFELVRRVRDYGMDFTYLLNSVNTPRPEWFKAEQDCFRSFLEKLLKNGVTKIRTSNTLVTDYIIQNYPEFTIYGSTSQEYWSIKQYANYFEAFPSINEVVPSWDLNHNFKFIDNFQLRFPNKTLEFMVNEGCISGCPFRRDHHAFNTKMQSSSPNDRFFHFFSSSCANLSKDKILYVCLANIIYPWDIATYNKHGIYNFKLIGRNSPDFLFQDTYIHRFDTYLRGIEDIDSILDTPFIDLNHYTIFQKHLSYITVRDVKEYLPKLSHFEKVGHLCSVACGIDCKYCYQCADYIKKSFRSQRKDEK